MKKYYKHNTRNGLIYIIEDDNVYARFTDEDDDYWQKIRQINKKDKELLTEITEDEVFLELI